MSDDSDRTALLDRILAEGGRRKRRRWFLSGGGLVLALAVVALAWPGVEHEDRVATATHPTTTTSTTTPPTTATTETAAVTHVVVADSTTTTAEPPLVCRNSTDPRCGPFYWDYDPATFPNAPIEITITHDPAVVRVGEAVTLHVLTYDADAHACPDYILVEGAVDIEYGNFGCGGFIARCRSGPRESVYVPNMHGPWDPPVVPTSPRPTQPHDATLRFDEPGTYDVRVTSTSMGGPCFSYPMYSSEGSATMTISVQPFDPTAHGPDLAP